MSLKQLEVVERTFAVPQQVGEGIEWVIPQWVQSLRSKIEANQKGTIMKATVFHRLNMRPSYKEIIARAALKEVATVQVSNIVGVDAMLEYVFRTTNSIEFPWYTVPAIGVSPTLGAQPQRSTSVGDIVLVEGKWFVCAPCGWEGIEEPK